MKIFHFLAIKLCIDCKHFIGEKNTKYGKCGLFKKIEDYTLVNGKDVDIDHYYCLTARTDNRMCGEKGKKYQLKTV